MNASFTLGPWAYKMRFDGSIYMSRGDTMTGPHHQSDVMGSEADIRLMTAAPDLLDAARTLLDCFVEDPLSWMNNQSEAVEKAREAIHKATGV